MSDRVIRFEVVVHVPDGMTVPPFTLQVGGPVAGVVAPGAPGAPAPALPEPDAPRALPPALAAWKATPEARARHYPQSLDEGQHDLWKREMAIVCWRLLAGPSVPVARGWFDLDGAAPSAPPPLFPLHTDLAQACQRLGLARLVQAALGFGERERSEAATVSEAPAGGAFRLLAGATAPGVVVPRVDGRLDGAELARRIAGEHASAVELALVTAEEHHAQMKKEWRGPGPYPGMQRDELAAVYALGPVGADVLTRLDLAGCPPLEPLRLAFDPAALGPVAPPRRTPSTGAAIPAAPTPEPTPKPAAAGEE